MYRKTFVILICATALFVLKLGPLFSANIENPKSAKADLGQPEKENLRTEYLNKYLLEIQQKIRKLCSNWYGGPKINFVIESDGNIKNFTLDQNFWNAEATKEFINTIHAAAPFPSLPDGLDYVKVQLPFFPHLGRWGLTLTPMESEYLKRYSPEIRQKIRKGWFPPKDARLPTLRFIILSNGNIENLVVSESSESFSSDDAALNAVQKAVPFPLLPDGLEHVRVELNFNGYYGGYFDGIDPMPSNII
jgi:TonB family protein